MSLLLVLALSAPHAAAEPVVCRYSPEADSWARAESPLADQAVAGNLTWLGAPQQPSLTLGTRNAQGRVSVWTCPAGSPLPVLAGALPEGPSAVLCALPQAQELWVGTDTGLYVGTEGRWRVLREIGFFALDQHRFAKGTIENVFAVWPLRDGATAIAARADPDRPQQGGIYRAPTYDIQLRGVDCDELGQAVLQPEVVTLDDRGVAYCLMESLIVACVGSRGVARVVDRDDTQILTAAGERRLRDAVESVPCLLFFDREEALWAGVHESAGNLMVRHEPHAWVIDDPATELLADQGALYVTKDSDDLVYMGTEGGKLFTFDGFVWKDSPFADAMEPWFADGKLPALRPVWTTDGKLWVAVGNLLFCFDCPAAQNR